MAKYLPLAFIDQEPSRGHVFDDIMRYLHSYGIENLSEDDFIKTMLSIEDGTIQDEMPNAKDYVMKFANAGIPYFQYLGITKQMFLDGDFSMATELMDIFLIPVLIDRWSRNKQVFKPDCSFSEALLKTKDVALSKTMLTHLPCTDFYIDLSEVKSFLPIEGAFVNVTSADDHADITVVLVSSKNFAYWTYYLGGVYDENELLKFDFTVMEQDAKDYNFTPSEEFRMAEYEWNASRSLVSFFCIQMVAYLSSREPDIEESEATKHTYKPPKNGIIKNQFKEVQQWEVGVRYGKSYRQRIKQIKAEEEGKEIGETAERAKRKSPAPHFRCAHWQRFWTGEGRSKCVLKWIEPTFVGDGKKAKDVVIHTI